MSTDKFGHKLVSWYLNDHRRLPWRETRDPYRIWLSEIILQQTRVAQGLPYYEKFVKNYPDVTSLANASEKEVLHLWQGLGYYSRARNLHATAKIVATDYKGIFPDNYQELLKLKGIGDYTASAIASFAFNEQVPVVDGNVFRVLSRYFGIQDDIALPASRKVFKEAALLSIPPKKASLFNQAIMEFGAMQCTPLAPKCPTCLIRESCYSFHHNTQSTLPVKTKKIRIKERFIHYLIFCYQNKVAMKERTGKDIWRGLYDFYSVETPAQHLNWQEHLPPGRFKTPPLLQAGPLRHILTHQQLQLSFWTLELNLVSDLPEGLTWYNSEEIVDLPKPLPINAFVKDFFVTL